ncbi:unnamed protein product [Sphagnum jensenii]|uniref:Uncharacterized protein n=1 Tax=Sphagnum jensenii TaxID=128206 RepID=A0ABP1C347_9BRYO
MQNSREASLTQSVFPSENPLGKKEKKEIRAPEVPAAPSNPARCQAPVQATQASSKRSDGGAHEGSRQRSPPKITLLDMSDQATSGADETASRPPPPSGKLLSILSSPSSLRIFFCVRGARFGTRSSRSHHRFGNDRDQSFGRKSEGSKREIDQKRFKEGSEHSQNGPSYKPDSDCAPGQRDALPSHGVKPT